jgi:hypothetical protein
MESMKIIAKALGVDLIKAGSRYKMRFPGGKERTAHSLEDVAYFLSFEIQNLKVKK